MTVPDTTPRTPGLEERLRKRADKCENRATYADDPWFEASAWLWEAANEIARLTAERNALLGQLEQIAGATVHPDTAVIMPASMSHMKVSDFAAWAQQIARAGLNPEGADHAE